MGYEHRLIITDVNSYYPDPIAIFDLCKLGDVDEKIFDIELTDPIYSPFPGEDDIAIRKDCYGKKLWEQNCRTLSRGWKKQGSRGAATTD